MTTACLRRHFDTLQSTGNGSSLLELQRAPNALSLLQALLQDAVYLETLRSYHYSLEKPFYLLLIEIGGSFQIGAEGAGALPRL